MCPLNMNTNDAYCINIDTPSCLFTFFGSASLYQSIKQSKHITVIKKNPHEHGKYSLYKQLEYIIEI